MNLRGKEAGPVFNAGTGFYMHGTDLFWWRIQPGSTSTSSSAGPTYSGGKFDPDRYLENSIFKKAVREYSTFKKVGPSSLRSKTAKREYSNF